MMKKLNPYMALLIFILFLGCGESNLGRYKVSGSVSVNGKSVTTGSISFTPSGDNRGPRAVSRITDGKFNIPASNGPGEGPHTIRIRIDSNMGTADRNGSLSKQLDTKSSGNVKANRRSRPSALTNNISEFEEVVSATDENEYAFEITSPNMK